MRQADFRIEARQETTSQETTKYERLAASLGPPGFAFRVSSPEATRADSETAIGLISEFHLRPDASFT